MKQSHDRINQKLEKDLKEIEKERVNTMSVVSKKRSKMKVGSNDNNAVASNYSQMPTYLREDPKAQLFVKELLYKRMFNLEGTVSLLTTFKESPHDKLIDKVYQDYLAPKTKKIPPKIYLKDRVMKKAAPPPPPTEIDDDDAISDIDFKKEKDVNFVSLLQRTLRGMALQKQMLGLIDKHSDMLKVILGKVDPPNSD